MANRLTIHQTEQVVLTSDPNAVIGCVPATEFGSDNVPQLSPDGRQIYRLSGVTIAGTESDGLTTNTDISGAPAGSMFLATELTHSIRADAKPGFGSNPSPRGILIHQVHLPDLVAAGSITDMLRAAQQAAARNTNKEN